MAIEGGGGEEGFQRRQDWEVAVLTEMADTYDTHTKKKFHNDFSTCPTPTHSPSAGSLPLEGS